MTITHTDQSSLSRFDFRDVDSEYHVSPEALMRARVDAQFDKRFEQTKVTREYGNLEILKFSIVKPIQSMLHSLLGGRLGTSFTQEEREELEIYRQNQAFYKQIGKMQTAYKSYHSAVAKSIAATPEEEAAAATAEYDKAQKLKGAYEALLKLAATQADYLEKGDATSVVNEESPSADEVDIDSGDQSASQSTQLSSEDIKRLNGARREELHNALALKNAHILPSIHMAESMLSVVVKVGDKVNYDQAKLLDFMACFDAKVEETLTHMSPTNRAIAKTIVQNELMQGLVATTGFGILESIDALAAISTKSRAVNETVQGMLQHFARVLSDLGNVPVNHKSFTTQEQKQETVKLEKALKGMYFQGMPLIGGSVSSDNMIKSIKEMQQVAYELDAEKTGSLAAQIKAFQAESKNLDGKIGPKNCLLANDVEFTVKDLHAFFPADIDFSRFANPELFSSLQRDLQELRELKAEINQFNKESNDACVAKNVEITQVENELTELETKLADSEQKMGQAIRVLDEKKQAKEKLLKQVETLTATLKKSTTEKSLAALNINPEVGVDAMMGHFITDANNAVETSETDYKNLHLENKNLEALIDTKAKACLQLQAGLEDLNTNGIPEESRRRRLAEATAKRDKIKDYKVTLTGWQLIEIEKEIHQCSRVGMVASCLETSKKIAQEIDQLSVAEKDKSKKADTAEEELEQLKRKFNSYDSSISIKLDESTNDVPVGRGAVPANPYLDLFPKCSERVVSCVEASEFLTPQSTNKLTIVPGKFFTVQQQDSMKERLVKSRLRTVQLTCTISQKILVQNIDDIQRRPYIKGHTARYRHVETAAMLGGLRANMMKVEELFKKSHSDVEDSHSDVEDSHSDVEDSHSDVEDSHSDVEDSHSDVEDSHSDVEDSHSDVEDSHSDVRVNVDTNKNSAELPEGEAANEAEIDSEGYADISENKYAVEPTKTTVVTDNKQF